MTCTKRTDYLNLNVHLDEALGKRVDFDQSRVDRAIETAEFGDQADVALRYWLVRIGANHAAWNGPTGADNGSQGCDCSPISHDRSFS